MRPPSAISRCQHRYLRGIIVFTLFCFLFFLFSEQFPRHDVFFDAFAHREAQRERERERTKKCKKTRCRLCQNFHQFCLFFNFYLLNLFIRAPPLLAGKPPVAPSSPRAAPPSLPCRSERRKVSLLPPWGRPLLLARGAPSRRTADRRAPPSPFCLSTPPPPRAPPRASRRRPSPSTRRRPVRRVCCLRRRPRR